MQSREMTLPLALFVVSVCPPPVLAHVTSGGSEPQEASRVTNSAPGKSTAVARCEAAGKNEITIDCRYTATPAPSSTSNEAPRIVLNRAVLSFKTKDDNQMHVELTFTNGGANRVSNSRSVYFSIDDEAGHNSVRRVLPSVDFRALTPGEELTFSERLLIPALRPGRYTIQLWIPDPDPSLMFNPSHNFLISSTGVPDRKTGLNTLAAFTVVR